MTIPRDIRSREMDNYVESSVTANKTAKAVTNPDGSNIGTGSTSGNVAHDAVDAGNPVKVGFRATNAQIAAVSTNDRTDAMATLYGEQIIAGYDYTNEVIGTRENNPICDQHREETLCSLTNITANTTAYLYIDMDSYKFASFQIQASSGGTDSITITCEASNQDDGTDASSCTYQDVTNDLFGVVSLVTANDFWVIDSPFAVKWLRIKYVTSNTGGNDTNLTVYHKRMY